MANQMPERGDKIAKAGWAITRFVYGTFFCLILIFIAYVLVRALLG